MKGSDLKVHGYPVSAFRNFKTQSKPDIIIVFACLLFAALYQSRSFDSQYQSSKICTLIFLTRLVNHNKKAFMIATVTTRHNTGSYMWFFENKAESWFVAYHQMLKWSDFN